MSKFNILKVGRQPRSMLAETEAAGDAGVNPWKSVNDMLIQNKCWLCEQVFARGKVKKVFMISHLLRYLEGRYGLESGELKMTVSVSQKPEAEETAKDNDSKNDNNEDDKMSAGVVQSGEEKEKEKEDSSTTPSVAPLVHIDMLKTLESPNLIAVYESYKAMKGDKALVAQELMKIECEVWMSGLICARTYLPTNPSLSNDRYEYYFHRLSS